MKCPKCGHEAMAGDAFCSRCGTKLENVCPNCGSKLREGDLFCSKCGAKLDVGARHAVPVQDEAVPKLEDMQDRLYIPEPLRKRMDTARQEMGWGIPHSRSRIWTGIYGSWRSGIWCMRNAPFLKWNTASSMS